MMMSVFLKNFINMNLQSARLTVVTVVVVIVVDDGGCGCSGGSNLGVAVNYCKDCCY